MQISVQVKEVFIKLYNLLYLCNIFNLRVLSNQLLNKGNKNMMISKVMVSTPLKSVKSTPAFGLAKLNETGMRTADSFGYQRNTFLNDRLFEKQGIFRKAAISEELAAGKSFVDVCTEYGCSPMAGANASFIQTQILTKKGQSAIKGIDPSTVQDGLLKLYECNYDNPELPLKDTRALLDLVKDSLDPTVYVQNIGLFEVGADR